MLNISKFLKNNISKKKKKLGSYGAAASTIHYQDSPCLGLIKMIKFDIAGFLFICFFFLFFFVYDEDITMVFTVTGLNSSITST